MIDKRRAESYCKEMRKKVQKEEEEKKLAEVECDYGQSRRQNEMIDLLKQIVDQNEKVIQLLTKLKERFI